MNNIPFDIVMNKKSDQAGLVIWRSSTVAENWKLRIFQGAAELALNIIITPMFYHNISNNPFLTNNPLLMCKITPRFAILMLLYNRSGEQFSGANFQNRLFTIARYSTSHYRRRRSLEKLLRGNPSCCSAQKV